MGAVRAVSALRVEHRDQRGRARLRVGDCPYLPEELNVFCDWCRFDFATMEGNSPCDDPLTCEHGVVPRAHVENYHRWAAAREALTTPGA
ncbi:MAG TPA: hypothetical protein VEO00_07100 [Actinomycetota bacterium]|nr:hypothetical protein [Actinomycetota bacterium]